MGFFKELAADRADIGGEFFGRPADMVAAVTPEKESPRPRHTCKHELGFTAVIQADITHVSPWQSNDYRNCPGCLYRRAQRVENQLKHEQQDKTLYALALDAAAWGKMRGRLKKRNGATYAAFPLEDGSFGILHNQAKEGGDNLDEFTHEDTFSLMQRWAATPDKKRVQTSKGWGGPWAGFKGNTAAKQERQAAEQAAADNDQPVTPQVVVKGKASPAAVARHFGVELKRGRRCTIEESWYTVYTGLVEVAGKEFETIDGQPVLPALLNTFVEWGKAQESAVMPESAADSPAVQSSLWLDEGKEAKGEKSEPAPDPAPIYLPNFNFSNRRLTYAGTG